MGTGAKACIGEGEGESMRGGKGVCGVLTFTFTHNGGGVQGQGRAGTRVHGGEGVRWRRALARVCVGEGVC